MAVNDHSLLDLSVEEARELLLLQQRLPNVDVNLHVVRPYNISALEQLLLETKSPTKDSQRRLVSPFQHQDVIMAVI